MKLYDITQEVFSCKVYPGDPAPQCIPNLRMAEGSLYNLTSFSMCAHNGTHIDAPFHFLKDGATAEAIPLHRTVGFAYVIPHPGAISAEAAAAILTKAAAVHPDCAKKLLLKGDALVTEEAAAVWAKAGVELVGVESQSVGPEDAPMAVHKLLLSAGVVLLEGLRLGEVPEGVYFLSAAPLALSGSDGAPCRAVLVEGLAAL